jgi:hypothetical protein
MMTREPLRTRSPSCVLRFSSHSHPCHLVRLWRGSRLLPSFHRSVSLPRFSVIGRAILCTYARRCVILSVALRVPALAAKSRPFIGSTSRSTNRRGVGADFRVRNVGGAQGCATLPAPPACRCSAFVIRPVLQWVACIRPWAAIEAFALLSRASGRQRAVNEHSHCCIPGHSHGCDALCRRSDQPVPSVPEASGRRRRWATKAKKANWRVYFPQRRGRTC